jgi:LysM repeat protein
MKKKKTTGVKPEVAEKPKKGIVIAETEEDVILGGGTGDPDDFINEVKKEAEKGRFLRTIMPILVFLLLGAIVAYGTMYYKNQSDDENSQKTEDKIQTPPTVTEEEAATTTTTPPPAPAPTTPTVTTPTTTTGYTVYTVVSGDTLSGIANAHDMTSSALASYNGISVDALLQIGQKLKIPN